MDPAWGRLVIKMSGHPPFGAQVILNGHEYVACQAQAIGIGFTKEGNCFTGITDPDGLAQIAETLSQDAAIGRLGQACDRWIYAAGACASGWTWPTSRPAGSATPIRFTRPSTAGTSIFASGARMDRVFGTVADPDPVPAGRAGAADPVRDETAAGRHRTSPR